MFEKLLCVVHMEFSMAALISSRIQVHPQYQGLTPGILWRVVVNNNA